MSRHRSLKIIGRILASEIHGRAVRWLQKLLQRTVHPLGIVGLVNITVMQSAIGIVQRDIKQRIAHQRRQPRHRFRPAGIMCLEQSRQLLFNKIATHFQWMTARLKLRPGFGESFAERFQRLMPILIRQGTGPNPSNTKGSFTPAIRRAPLRVTHGDPAAGTGDVGDRFAAKLQRHTGVNGQEKKFRSNRSYVSGQAHGGGSR